MQDAHEWERGDIPLAEEGLVAALLCADAQATVDSGYEREIARVASDVREGSYTPETYADDVADRVQQYMHDSHIDTTWPSCPRHPNHPMWAYRGVWSCGGDPIAPLGALSILRTHEETGRYSSLSRDGQLRVLASFGHSLTIAAREGYGEQDAEGADPRRLRDVNEILHRVLSHIHALASHDRARYPDTVIVAILLESGIERLRVQAQAAMRHALDRYAG